MTALERVARIIRHQRDVWLVDASGSMHSMSWAAYSQLTAAELHGCRAYCDVHAALRCAARIWRAREARS